MNKTAKRQKFIASAKFGISSLVALSAGETVPTPQWTKNAARSLRRAQRAVARKTRHNRRQRKAKARVARLHARVASQRRDFSHKLSRSLVSRFSHLAFEALNITGLARGQTERFQIRRDRSFNRGLVVEW